MLRQTTRPANEPEEPPPSTGSGTVGALVRSFDWSTSRIGPVASWPSSLETTVGIVLGSHLPMLLWWGEDLVQIYNDSCRPLLGNKHPLALGAPAREVWSELWHLVGPVAEGALRGDAGSYAPLRLLLTRNGHPEEVYFTFAFSPVPEPSGAVGGVLVIVEEQAALANRARDAFLAMLGHELRNPLAPMTTALQILKRRGVHSREHDILERQVTHLNRLVEDLLDVSRITRGVVSLRREVVELSQVVGRGIELASPLLEQRGHGLAVEVLRRGLPVDADAGRLSQVVSNLLTNAAKFSEPGSTIRLTAVLDGEWIRLSVHDTGIGIAADMLDKVFDLFTQEAQSLDRTTGGLGLGLAIVRNLVQLHGGRVEARSDGPGRGTEFVVTLPVARPPPVVSPRRPRGGVRRILVVDDNRDLTLMLQAALEAMGHAVEVAWDGPSALVAAERFRPDLALLDIDLPVMDGYELAARLREILPPPVHLVAVTGYGQEADIERARRAGFARHVLKPVDTSRLRELVDEPTGPPEPSGR